MCKVIASRFGKFRCQLCAYIYGMVLMLIFPFVAYSPEHVGIGLFLGFLIGIFLGWIYPANRALYCAIIPGGEEAELMG